MFQPPDKPPKQFPPKQFPPKPPSSSPSSSSPSSSSPSKPPKPNTHSTKIQHVDICCGLNWGDEAKGKITANLAKTGNYHFVCRWAGGHNAGHTIYVNQIKYKTHLIPCGVFYHIPSIIGPDCVLHPPSFFEEIHELEQNGFHHTKELVKISPKTHIVTNQHIQEDQLYYQSTQGSTAKGIAPCYRDKYARKGIQAKDIPELQPYLWDEQLYGNILCEGAQGFWLDINQGNYPYVTSSTTLPYGACSLGFPIQHIRHIYGASKLYDTRAGIDPEFPESLLDDPELASVAKYGHEYGTTTGRPRKVQWLQVDKLIHAIQTTGTTHVIVSKIDVLEQTNQFKYWHQQQLQESANLTQMKQELETILYYECPLLQSIQFTGEK